MEEVNHRSVLAILTSEQKSFNPLYELLQVYNHTSTSPFSAVQVQDENSLTRQKSAALLPKSSKIDFLSLLGDTSDKTYPIYMTGCLWKSVTFFSAVRLSILCLMPFAFLTGPVLYTLCTVLIDLDENTLSITEGNPEQREPSYVFSMS